MGYGHDPTCPHHAGNAALTFGVENVFDHMYRAHLDPYTLYRPGRNLFVRMSRAF